MELSDINELEPGKSGWRLIISIISVTVRGERINGTILAIGADWQTLYDDRTVYLDTRYAFRTDDVAVIEIINVGYRHGPPIVMRALARDEDVNSDTYYVRTRARLGMGDARYRWINNLLFVGAGGRKMSTVELSLFVVG